ncbi:hypothetical protein M422DRAFT_257993 [Sphaerobolus stellatus SS14]|uniref:Uncharacterized protein n=1 Tax=Sphaerobolus stellatus (strain SS14) TaxID=990650 RepID=A0A0C9U7X6_SPHS4|nr:hypothetical protein M422DRAFT_257993 [Sphaerobolus stellatus SS14]
MSTCRTCKQAEKLSAQAVVSVDPQQSIKVFATEHPNEPSMRAHGLQTVPTRIQSPIGVAGAARSSMPSQHLSQVATASGTATNGRDSPQRTYSGSDSGHDLDGAPDESDSASPHEGGMENEDGSFTIKASELGKL